MHERLMTKEDAKAGWQDATKGTAMFLPDTRGFGGDGTCKCKRPLCAMDNARLWKKTGETRIFKNRRRETQKAVEGPAPKDDW